MYRLIVSICVAFSLAGCRAEILIRSDFEQVSKQEVPPSFRRSNVGPVGMDNRQTNEKPSGYHLDGFKAIRRRRRQVPEINKFIHKYANFFVVKFGPYSKKVLNIHKFINSHGLSVFRKLEQLMGSGISEKHMIKICDDLTEIGERYDQLDNMETETIALLPSPDLKAIYRHITKDIYNVLSGVDQYVDNYVASLPEKDRKRGRDFIIKLKDLTNKLVVNGHSERELYKIITGEDQYTENLPYAPTGLLPRGKGTRGTDFLIRMKDITDKISNRSKTVQDLYKILSGVDHYLDNFAALMPEEDDEERARDFITMLKDLVIELIEEHRSFKKYVSEHVPSAQMPLIKSIVSDTTKNLIAN